MPGTLNILMVSSECNPFAKTGGLGDVTGALPQYLKQLGHNVIVVIPMYSFIDRAKYSINVHIHEMHVKAGYDNITCRVMRGFLTENVPVFFIDYEPYFSRPNIYHDNYYNDYSDNPKRFIFLSEAALNLCHKINFVPDIVHAHDWHTAILPAYLKRTRYNDPLFRNSAGVLTIHNIAYQGRYDRYFYNYSGLGAEDFTPDKFECHNAVNFLKGGIFFADKVNTVSKGYAEETRTTLGGHGLNTILIKKGDDYEGILNGADYSEWDPEKDQLIPACYSRDDLEGKQICKRQLRQQMKLDDHNKVPVIGIVSRFAWQKGLFLLAECIEDIINDLNVQFAILGSGDNQLESFFSSMHMRYPGKIGLYTGYNNELAHLIEAGSDFFLMPSIYEPCGLNQIYSLKYGTLPIVRATGGLNDTVENYNQDTGEGTGFKFFEISGMAIYGTVRWAVETFFDRDSHMQKLIKKAMTQVFSWEASAREYVRLYKSALKKKRMSINQ